MMILKNNLNNMKKDLDISKMNILMVLSHLHQLDLNNIK